MHRELEDALIQLMLMLSILLHLARESGEGSWSPPHVCLKWCGNNLQRDCPTHATQHKSNGKRSKQSKSWSNWQKNRESEGDRTSKRTSKSSKGKSKSSKTVLSGTQETSQTHHSDDFYTDNSWFDGGWSCDEWNDDRNCWLARRLGWTRCKFRNLILLVKF